MTVRTAAGDTLATLAQAAAVDVGYFGGVNAGPLACSRPARNSPSAGSRR